jgi:hypothetical protein
VTIPSSLGLITTSSTGAIGPNPVTLSAGPTIPGGYAIKVKLSGSYSTDTDGEIIQDGFAIANKGPDASIVDYLVSKSSELSPETPTINMAIGDELAAFTYSADPQTENFYLMFPNWGQARSAGYYSGKLIFTVEVEPESS